jgi:hypothetical protein
VTAMTMQCPVCFEQFAHHHSCRGQPLPGHAGQAIPGEAASEPLHAPGVLIVSFDKLARNEKRFQAACAALRSRDGDGGYDPKWVAAQAVRVADALLAELEKEPGT